MNSFWIEQKYANIVSSSLEMCKNKSKGGKFAINFRCPYCGDSEKSRYKTRGWLYEKDNSIRYKCFNCGITPSFAKFLEFINPTLYNDFQFEKFGYSSNSYKKKETIEFPKNPKIETFKNFNIQSIAELDDTHYAKKYIISRKIPKEKHDKIYYVDNFYAWTNTIIPNKFDDKVLSKDEARIVFLLKNENNEVFGFQGRTLNKNSKLRYITIMIDENQQKCFGLETIDKTKKSYIVEGPIDSLFLSNGIAMVGADAHLEKVVDKNNSIIIFDNEPRNKQIISRMYKYNSNGWTICVWPSHINQKDINDMVLSGKTASEIENIIVSNSFSGLSGELAINFWSKA